MGVGGWYGLNQRLEKYELNRHLDISHTNNSTLNAFCEGYCGLNGGLWLLKAVIAFPVA